MGLLGLRPGCQNLAYVATYNSSIYLFVQGDHT